MAGQASVHLRSRSSKMKEGDDGSGLYYIPVRNDDKLHRPLPTPPFLRGEDPPASSSIAPSPPPRSNSSSSNNDDDDDDRVRPRTRRTTTQTEDDDVVSAKSKHSPPDSRPPRRPCSKSRSPPPRTTTSRAFRSRSTTSMSVRSVSRSRSWDGRTKHYDRNKLKCHDDNEDDASTTTATTATTADTTAKSFQQRELLSTASSRRTTTSTTTSSAGRSRPSTGISGAGSTTTPVRERNGIIISRGRATERPHQRGKLPITRRERSSDDYSSRRCRSSSQSFRARSKSKSGDGRGAAAAARRSVSRETIKRRCDQARDKVKNGAKDRMNGAKSFIVERMVKHLLPVRRNNNKRLSSSLERSSSSSSSSSGSESAILSRCDDDDRASYCGGGYSKGGGRIIASTAPTTIDTSDSSSLGRSEFRSSSGECDSSSVAASSFNSSQIVDMEGKDDEGTTKKERNNVRSSFLQACIDYDDEAEDSTTSTEDDDYTSSCSEEVSDEESRYGSSGDDDSSDDADSRIRVMRGGGVGSSRGAGSTSRRHGVWNARKVASSDGGGRRPRERVRRRSGRGDRASSESHSSEEEDGGDDGDSVSESMDSSSVEESADDDTSSSFLPDDERERQFEDGSVSSHLRLVHLLEENEVLRASVKKLRDDFETMLRTITHSMDDTTNGTVKGCGDSFSSDDDSRISHCLKRILEVKTLAAEKLDEREKKMLQNAIVKKNNIGNEKEKKKTKKDEDKLKTYQDCIDHLLSENERLYKKVTTLSKEQEEILEDIRNLRSTVSCQINDGGAGTSSPEAKTTQHGDHRLSLTDEDTSLIHNRIMDIVALLIENMGIEPELSNSYEEKVDEAQKKEAADARGNQILQLLSKMKSQNGAVSTRVATRNEANNASNIDKAIGPEDLSDQVPTTKRTGVAQPSSSKEHNQSIVSLGTINSGIESSDNDDEINDFMNSDMAQIVAPCNNKNNKYGNNNVSSNSLFDGTSPSTVHATGQGSDNNNNKEDDESLEVIYEYYSESERSGSYDDGDYYSDEGSYCGDSYSSAEHYYTDEDVECPPGKGYHWYSPSPSRHSRTSRRSKCSWSSGQHSPVYSPSPSKHSSTSRRGRRSLSPGRRSPASYVRNASSNCKMSSPSPSRHSRASSTRNTTTRMARRKYSSSSRRRHSRGSSTRNHHREEDSCSSSFYSHRPAIVVSSSVADNRRMADKKDMPPQVGVDEYASLAAAAAKGFTDDNKPKKPSHTSRLKKTFQDHFDFLPKAQCPAKDYEGADGSTRNLNPEDQTLEYPVASHRDSGIRVKPTPPACSCSESTECASAAAESSSEGIHARSSSSESARERKGICLTVLTRATPRASCHASSRSSPAHSYITFFNNTLSKCEIDAVLEEQFQETRELLESPGAMTHIRCNKTKTKRNKGVYQGEYNSDGQRHGYGICTSKNGNEYRGEWQYHNREGLGVVKIGNGDVFEGQFENNLKNGIGVYHYKDGECDLSRYVDDRRIGETVRYSKDRQRAFLLSTDLGSKRVSLEEAARVAKQMGTIVAC